MKRHRFFCDKVLFPTVCQGPLWSHTAPVAEENSEVYRAARAGLEMGTTKHLWDKLSTGNESRLPDQHGQSSTACSKEDQR